MIHPIQDKWCIYIHFPNDCCWDESSYKLIYTFKNLEEAIMLLNLISDTLYTSCMFFLMRSHVKPMWEHPENKDGGAFSFKIDSHNVKNVFTKFSFQAIGESIVNIPELNKYINGITLSPKKHFAIVKIWTSSCINQDPNNITYFDNLTSNGCIFKKHIVE